MREHLGFLKTSSVVVKIAAWVFLCLGIIGGVSIFLKESSGYPKLMILFGSAVYIFFFFLFYIIAKIADLLTKIINEIHELKKSN